LTTPTYPLHLDSLTDLVLSIVRHPYPRCCPSEEMMSNQSNNDALPPYTELPPLQNISPPSTSDSLVIHGINVYYHLHLFEPYDVEPVRAIFQNNTREVYSREMSPRLLRIVRFGELETSIILGGISPCLISTWIPRITNR
jgi:hypothetical protein